MKSFCPSFALVVTVWASGATVAAQVPGPINATGTSAAFVSAESTGHPLVGMGSDATPYGIIGTFSNHPLGFRTNNIARMFIDTNGNVGIGTTGPGYKLDVSGDANITGTYRVNGVPISATSNWTQAGNNIYYTTGNVGIGTTTPNFPLSFANTLGDKISLWGQSGTHYGFGIQPFLLQIYSAQDIAFGTGSSAIFAEAMRIKAGGTVGIGTNNPSTAHQLHVLSHTAGVLVQSSSGIAIDGSSGNGTGVHGYSAIGTAVDGNSGNGVGVNGYGDVGVQGAGTEFGLGVHGVTDRGTGVLGGSSHGTGVQGYSTSGIGVYGVVEDPYGWAGYFDGGVHVNGSVCASNVPCLSDARSKQNVQPLDYGLPHLMRLRPVRWSWVDPTQKQLALGLIAQEVEPVLPELILRNADTTGTLGLNYFGFVPVMIKAIQEQQDTITALKAENARLDVRLRALEQALLHQSQAQ